MSVLPDPRKYPHANKPFLKTLTTSQAVKKADQILLPYPVHPLAHSFDPLSWLLLESPSPSLHFPFLSLLPPTLCLEFVYTSYFSKHSLLSPLGSLGQDFLVLGRLRNNFEPLIPSSTKTLPRRTSFLLLRFIT